MRPLTSTLAVSAVLALMVACGPPPKRGDNAKDGDGTPPVEGTTGGADAEAGDDGIMRTSDPLVNPDSLLEVYDASKATETEYLHCTLDGNPANLNPLFMSSTYEFRMAGFMFDGPFTFNEKMEWMVNDAMVESLEKSADNKVWTLKLKPGLKWHDGHAFTAHDIAYSWEQILDDAVPCPSQKPGTDEIELCEAVDDLTVRYVHKNPLPTSKWNVYFSIIPKHIFEKGKAEDASLKTSDYYARINREMVGNGAYKFVEWLDNDKIVLERWDDFHGAKPHFERVVCRIIPDAGVQMLTFEKQETDEFRMSPQQFAVESVESEAFNKVGVKALAAQWGFYYIGWNQDGSNPFFNDTRVRRAMTHALNVPLLIQEVGYGIVSPCHGIYHPDSPMYNDEIELIPYDLDKARALLDEAGWTVDPETGWRTKGVDRFEFTMTLPQGSSIAPNIAAVFQEDLKRIGVDMKQQVLEWSTFVQKNREHDFVAQISGWGTGTDPDTGWNLWHSTEYDGGRNYGKFENARVDELLLLARNEFDHEKRMSYYAEMQKIIYDEQPYTFIWNSSTLWAFNKRIRGVIYSPRGVWNFEPSSNAWWVHKSEQMHNHR